MNPNITTYYTVYTGVFGTKISVLSGFEPVNCLFNIAHKDKDRSRTKRIISKLLIKLKGEGSEITTKTENKYSK